MAGCESRDGKVPAAPLGHDLHWGRQHRIVRSCTSASVVFPTLTVERGALGSEGCAPWIVGKGIFFLLVGKRLTALVFESLEAAHLSVCIQSRDLKDALTETTAGEPWRETYS